MDAWKQVLTPTILVDSWILSRIGTTWPSFLALLSLDQRLGSRLGMTVLLGALIAQCTCTCMLMFENHYMYRLIPEL